MTLLCYRFSHYGLFTDWLLFSILPDTIQQPKGGKEGWQMEKRHPGSERCLLAHDLNNDLGVILKRCTLLERVVTGAESTKHLSFIRAAAEHMAERIAERPCDYGQPRTKAG